MAVLTQPVFRGSIFADQIGEDVAPEGTYTATIIDIVDQFGQVRQKFESNETELIDVTSWLFGFRDEENKPHRIASREMRISGSEKSNLYGFLKSILGRAPTYGWDYCELKGAKCLLTVEHVQRKDGNGIYPAIAALSPLPKDMDKPKTAPATPSAKRVITFKMAKPEPTPRSAQHTTPPVVEEDDLPMGSEPEPF